MTQPIGFSSSLNYTPYEPDLERCEGTGGAGGSPSDGAEGAGNTPNTQPARHEAWNCTTELLKTTATCGGVLLASRVLTPLAALGLLNCLANAAELVECLNEPETKVQGQ